MIARMRGSIKAFIHGQKVYALHVLGLLAPGLEIPVVRAHQVSPQSLDEWSDEDLGHMIEEGRRQLDRQLSDLTQIRSRAQWLFTVGAAIIVAVAGALGRVDPTGWLLALWLFALTLLAYGVAGAAAILTVRADFKTIDTAVLSASDPPVLSALAMSYSRMLGTGENTVATRLTVLWQAVVFIILGGYLVSPSASHLSGPPSSLF